MEYEVEYQAYWPAQRRIGPDVWCCFVGGARRETTQPVADPAARPMARCGLVLKRQRAEVGGGSRLTTSPAGSGEHLAQGAQSRAVELAEVTCDLLGHTVEVHLSTY